MKKLQCFISKMAMGVVAGASPYDPVVPVTQEVRGGPGRTPMVTGTSWNMERLETS